MRGAWCFLMLALVSCAACRVAAPSSDDTTIATSGEHRYSLALAQGWHQVASPNPAFADLYRSDDGAATLLVSVELALGQNGGSAPNVRVAADDLRRRGAYVEVRGPIDVGGTQSELLIFDFRRADGFALRSAQVAFRHNSRNYAFTFGSVPELFEDRLREYHTMLRSVRFST